MSGNRRKQTSTKPPASTEEPVAARVVAIPKDPAAAKPEVKAKPRSERIGDILRQSRLDRNEDLYQIAEYLCIKPPFLVALENSNYDAFPADAYVIGFLRTYANFLGVDGKDAVDRYRYEMAGRRKKPVLSMPQPMTEGRAPSGIIMVGVTIAILLIYASWYGLSSSNRAEVSVAPPLPTTQQVVPSTTPDVGPAAGLTAPIAVPVAPSDTSSTSTTPPPPAGIPLAGTAPQSTLAKEEPIPKDGDKNAAPSSSTLATADNKDAKATKDAKDGKKQVYGDANEASHIVIRATQSSWVMVTDDFGKAIFDHVLKPGDIYKVPNKPGLSLTTGNGSGLTLSLNGTDLPKIASGAPHVVRNIPLDPDRLSATPQDQ